MALPMYVGVPWESAPCSTVCVPCMGALCVCHAWVHVCVPCMGACVCAMHGCMCAPYTRDLRVLLEGSTEVHPLV